MLAPPLPMMFLWNCLKMGTDREKLFSICKRRERKGKERNQHEGGGREGKCGELQRTRSAMIFWRNLAHFSTSFLGPRS